MKIGKGKVVLKLSEGCLDPPAKVVKIFKSSHIELFSWKVCKKILIITFPDLKPDDAHAYGKRGTFVFQRDKVEILSGSQVLVTGRIKAFSDALPGQNESMVEIKFIGIRKRESGQERAGTKRVFSADQEILSGMDDMSDRIEAGIAAVCEVKDLPGDRISIDHSAEGTVFSHFSSGAKDSIDITVLQESKQGIQMHLIIPSIIAVIRDKRILVVRKSRDIDIRPIRGQEMKPSESFFEWEQPVKG